MRLWQLHRDRGRSAYSDLEAIVPTVHNTAFQQGQYRTKFTHGPAFTYDMLLISPTFQSVGGVAPRNKASPDPSKDTNQPASVSSNTVSGPKPATYFLS